ncbi:hypothetical protein NAMH_0376 [Nautilia profundicola AmH]|uniref:Uncharacterized protein n=1 Tax=Nautilia profundicola (strain ATCC BAA-1463 / DSM 18972 / AmH) TaxID=598659 RepID=B9L841_NAUPA|nr:hypothetical protein [Nautilia profundicola]ACM93328.1 hypothetical protein NAMH_0376 [Nautilia profundicola AmH]
MKIAKWSIAALISYGATLWIKNLVFNFVASILVWYLTLYYLNKFLEG